MTQYFSVKDFETFQHYKDRSPPWIKLYNSTLDDYEISKLPDASKAHLFAIWLLASRYDNRIPYDAEWIASRINATDVVNLDVLLESGKILLEQGCSNTLARCKQNAIPEGETETETEGEKSREKTVVDFSAFDLFWEQFPRQRRGNKAKAQSAYERALKEGRATEGEIAAGLAVYAKSKEVIGGYAKGAAAWLNDDRWADDHNVASNIDNPVDMVFAKIEAAADKNAAIDWENAYHAGTKAAVDLFYKYGGRKVG